MECLIVKIAWFFIY